LCPRGACIGKGQVKEVRNGQKSLQTDRFGKLDRWRVVAVDLVARCAPATRKFGQRRAHDARREAAAAEFRWRHHAADFPDIPVVFVGEANGERLFRRSDGAGKSAIAREQRREPIPRVALRCEQVERSVTR